MISSIVEANILYKINGIYDLFIHAGRIADTILSSKRMAGG
jgi:hypothetical protein